MVTVVSTTQAISVNKSDNQIRIDVTTLPIRAIKQQEVLVECHFSSVNYKDKLICSGNPGLVRKFPCVPGIDACGIVRDSMSDEFAPGDKVMSIATPFGCNIPGGWSRYFITNSRYLMKLPRGLELCEAAALGTAGFTSLLAVLTLEKHLLSNTNAPVLITAGTSGVGSFAIRYLKSRGFTVHTVIRNGRDDGFVRTLGADENYIDSDFCNALKFPLLKETYSAVIDNLGGPVLSCAIRKVISNGGVAMVGIAASETLSVSIIPFILRGVTAYGINAEGTDSATRRKIWSEVVRYKEKISIESLYTITPYHELPKCPDTLSKHAPGRQVISFQKTS